MPISENDMRWFAARLSIAIHDVKRFGGMSVHELKQALKDVPGVESLTMGYAPNGDELVTIAGRTVTVSPSTSNEAIRAAFLASALPVATTPIPAMAPINQPQGKPMTTTPAPGSFAASIRAMMDEARAGVAKARADGLAQIGDAVGKLNEAKDATAHVAGSMAKTISDEANDVMGELSQLSNDLGGTSA